MQWLTCCCSVLGSWLGLHSIFAQVILSCRVPPC